jgi:hypothetical protein
MKQGTPDVLEVMFGHGPSDVAFLTGARILAAHPDQDVLVLELSESPVAAIGVEPLEIVRTLGSLEAGGLVQLGGFGLDQATTLQREFVVAEIQSLSSTSVTVSAAGLGGACFGDSGGPLLVRSQDGHAGTLGVLDAGSASCAGVDLYTRLDTLIDWLPADARLTAPVGAADAGLTEPVDRPYQSLGQEGRCFGTTAVWTDADQLDAMHCEAGRVCGWSEHSGGFRCVESGSDPCSGVDDLGRCEDGVAVQCTRGQLTRNACKACGFTCARSPKTGRAICLAP